jgi:hypothetical protein
LSLHFVIGGVESEPKPGDMLIYSIPEDLGIYLSPLVIKVVHVSILVPFSSFDCRSLVNSLQQNGKLLPLYGRSAQIQKISHVFEPSPDKTPVGVLVSTRGMGKTTLLKALIDPSAYGVTLNIPLLEEARSVGRLAAVTLEKFSAIASHPNYDQELWIHIILDHLLKIFKGCFIEMDNMRYEFRNMEQLRNRLEIADASQAFDYWIRFTNAAFNTNSNSRPVILIDEISHFLQLTTEMSRTAGKFHTKLSNALNQIGGRCFIILAGNKDGDLNLLSNYTHFFIINVPLTVLSLNDVLAMGRHYFDNDINWPHDLEALNENHGLLAILYQTLFVPRLITLAFKAYSKILAVPSNTIDDVFHEFGQNFKYYYPDASNTFENFSDSMLVHLLLFCACGYRRKPFECIPGTDLLVSEAVNCALIFPFENDR